MSVKKSISLVLNLALLFWWLFPYPSQAEWVDFDGGAKASQAMDAVMGRTEQIYSSVEDRYGFDKDTLRSAKRKASAPVVEILFNNSNPRPGEKVTANAIPEFFKNDPQNLYYTWYLIHTKNGKPQTATNTMAKAKIEAARYMARGDYDPELDGQKYEDASQDPDHDGWPTTDNNNEKSYAPMGGADGVGGLEKASVERSCNGRGSRSADLCNFEVSDPTSTSYYTLSSSQSNYWCGQCYDCASGPGCSITNENSNYDCYTANPPTQTQPITRIITQLPYNSATNYCNITDPTLAARDSRNSCCYSVDPPTYTDPDTGDTITYPFSATTDYCTGHPYEDPFKTCFDDFGAANKTTVSECLNNRYSDCVRTYTSVNDEIYQDVSRCYKHRFSSGTDTRFRTDDESGLDFPVDCEHKWESAPNYVSGSGHFKTGEEKYWKTDPTDPDTDGDGFFDEADVIGLGQESFTWNYQPGDRVGVVVEGTSIIPTDEKNAYYKIEWGYLGVCDGSKKDLLDDDECSSANDYGYGFLATVAPGEEGNENLKVSLSYSPDNPLADPSDDNKDNINAKGSIANADQISVASSLDNTAYNPSDLYYTWQISKSDDPVKDNWEEIKDVEENFDVTSKMNGLGLTTLNFTPKKQSLEGTGDIAYFKVTLTASTAADIKAGRGRTSVVIPVNKNGIKIKFFKVDIKDGKAVLGDEICKDGLYQALCPAVHNQLVAAKAESAKYKAANSAFLWKIDEEAQNPPPDYSQLFDGWNDTTIFFPITKNEQEIEDVSVTATPKESLQPSTTTRLITVVQPAPFIRSSDTNISWPNVYIAPKEDTKNAFESVESDTNFDVLAGSSASYYLDFVPYYLVGEDYLNTFVDWSLNGESLTTGDYADNPLLEQGKLEDNYRKISFPVSTAEGQIYTVGATIKKYWSDGEKNILLSAWNIIPETLTGETDITVSTVAASPGATVNDKIPMGPKKQFLAAIGTHTPHYFAYLLRLVLTIIVMFFVSAVLYGVSQRIGFDDNR